MITVDDFIKIMLAAGITFSLVGISYQIMRLIGSTADILSDLRRAAQNVSTASDLALEDYKFISSGLRRIGGLLDSVSSLAGVVRGVAGKLGRMR